ARKPTVRQRIELLGMRSPTRCPGSTATFPPTRTFRRRRSAVQPSDDAWNLLNRLAKVYISPDAEVPGAEGSWLHRALLRRAHRRRWLLGIELALNSGHLTAKPSALTRSAQPALGALNDSCVAIASPKGHARPFPEHPYLTNTGPALSIRKITNNSSHRRGGDVGASRSWAIP